MSNILPPGQVETQKFPVVGEKAPPAEALDLGTWRLVVDGLVEQPLELTYDDILAMPQEERPVDIHCVTGWSQYGMTFTGFPVVRLLERARPRDGVRFVRFAAYSDRGHDTSLPYDLVRDDTWLVHSYGGQPLEPRHGYPLRTLTPSRYFFKSLKWVRRIELLAEDRLGFWERESNYHNQADPWAGDQRFTSGSLEPKKLERLRTAKSLKSYRGAHKVLIGLDLRAWDPLDRDLSDLHFKGCDLRDARLAGVDLRRANLSLCDLRGADLRGANLRGADIEGANLLGADLRDVDLRDSFLSATRFCETQNDTQTGAKVAGLRFDGASGTLEGQEAYLEANV